MKVLDLCAGTGSATQAFKERDHEVITLDLTGDVDIRCDIREWAPRNRQFDFIWASPPCTEFSIAKRIPYKDRNPYLSIVQACVRIIEEIKPQYWVMENPRGALRHFIGKPAATIKYSDYGYVCAKPTDLWGNFPFFWSRTKPNKSPTPWGIAFPHHSKNWKGLRAQVPYGLSLAICLALEDEFKE